MNSLQCANEITPASQSSNPICGFQGSLHVFAGHSLALLGTSSYHLADILVTCRTIHLHCQICWNLQVTRIRLIALNVIGWLIPAIFLGVVYGVAQITYTLSNHCSIREDWIVDLLIIPVIIEISCAIAVQFATFVYCVNVYLRSLREPPPPTDDEFGNGFANSTASMGFSRFPYRKAVNRVHKVYCFHSFVNI